MKRRKQDSPEQSQPEDSDASFTPVGIYRTDLEGRCTYVNDAWCRMAGLTPAEAMGDGWIEGIHPDDRKEFLAAWREMVQNGASWVRRYRFRDRDGRVTVVHGHAAPFTDGRGGAPGYIGTAAHVAEQSQAAQKRRMSGMQLREAERIGKIGSWSYNLREDEIWWSPGTYRIFGVNPSEGPPRLEHVLNRVHPDDRARLAGEINAGKSYRIDYRIFLPGGEERWIHEEAQIAGSPEEEPAKYYGTAQDVTKIKSAQLQLRASEKQYRDLIRTIPVAVVVHAPDTAIILSNSRAQELLGLAEEEILNGKAGDPLWTFLDEDGAPMTPEDHPVTRVLEDGKPIREKVLGIRRSSGGEPVWVLVNADPVYRDGELDRVVVSFVDMTERIKAETALRASEDKFRALFKGSPTPTFSWQRVEDDFVLVGYSDAAMALTGGKLNGFMRVKASDMYRDRPDIIDDLTRCLAGKNAFSRKMEYRFVSTGETRHFSASYAYVVPDTVLVHAVDETDRVRAEEALREAQGRLEEKVRERTADLQEANEKLLQLDTLKTLFIASMSHELRTPLNAIIGFSGILLQGMAGELNDEQERQLTMVRTNADHLLALINDVIDVSKIEAGKIVIEEEEFDLADVAGEVLASLDKEAGEKDINLTCSSCGSVPVRSDRRRVKQIIMNLVVNALKFTPRGSVSLRLIRKGAQVKAIVTDTGIGIADEDIDKLFQAFSRLEKGDAHKKGTGLGLYLSRRIAILLGGDVTVQSKSGKGSTFTLILPGGRG